MVKSTTENGASVAPFLMKCYEMVDDQTTDALLSWCSNGDSFVILDVTKFETELLPKFFKHRNISSFIRQLNIYGFRKIDTDRWIFANDGFIKGQKHLLKNICRRKQSQVIVQQTPSQRKEDNGSGACEEEEKNNGLWNEVESLKADKNVLMQELIKLRQHQQNSQNTLVVLKEQIKGMERDQQQMLSFIVMAMQNPGFFIQLIHPKENNWRMAEASKGVLNRVRDDDQEQKVPSTEGMIVRYQLPVNQPSPQLDSEKSLELGLSCDELEHLFMNTDFSSEPMDESLLAPETHGPTVIPDLRNDYSLLEQFLLSSPLRENKEDGDSDTVAWETESTPCGSHLPDKLQFGTHTSGGAQNLELERLSFGFELDKDEKMELLTERMGNLASECNIKHQNNI